jgi:hypothetical protein
MTEMVKCCDHLYNTLRVQSNGPEAVRIPAFELSLTEPNGAEWNQWAPSSGNVSQHTMYSLSSELNYAVLFPVANIISPYVLFVL